MKNLKAKAVVCLLAVVGTAGSVFAQAATVDPVEPINTGTMVTNVVGIGGSLLALWAGVYIGFKLLRRFIRGMGRASG